MMTPDAVASSRSPLTSNRTTDGPIAWATAANAREIVYAEAGLEIGAVTRPRAGRAAEPSKTTSATAHNHDARIGDPRRQAKHRTCPVADCESARPNGWARRDCVTSGAYPSSAPSLDGDEPGSVRPAHAQQVPTALRGSMKCGDRLVGGAARPPIDLDDHVARAKTRLLGGAAVHDVGDHGALGGPIDPQRGRHVGRQRLQRETDLPLPLDVGV